MENFEQKIVNAVNEKLNDGTVEKLVAQYMEKGVSDALGNVFSYSGEGRKLIEKKLNEVIVPAIERHDFNGYLTKLDAVLTEIINKTSLAENKEILENFKALMKEPEMKEIKISEIFKKYCKHVAENVDTDDLKAFCEDGHPYYEHVTANIDVKHEDKTCGNSSFDDCTVIFTCEEDENLNCQIKLFKHTRDDKWSILGHYNSVDISSLKGLTDFEIFLMTLNRAFVKIVLDEYSDYDDDIKPEAEPEWELR